MRATAMALLRRAGLAEAGALLALFLLAGSAWVFAEVTENVLQGDTESIDEAILLSMRSPADRSDPVGPKWVEELGRDFTALGGVGILTLLTSAAIGYLLLVRKPRVALFLVVAIGGGIIVSLLLKEGFQRPRPELVPHESYVYTTSFPSGHSMMSASTYLTLAALLARVHRRRHVRAYLIALALFVTIAVGVSRIYLGVHWPTDVVAGWAAGAFWALLCGQIARRMQRRGEIEQEE